jgi:hypothetical protein
VTRFQPQQSPRELMGIVAVVARAARPDKPEAVSMRAWDDARADAGYPNAPRAHAITQRLEVSWRELVRIALDRPDDAWRQLTHAAADKGRRGVSLERILVALRQVAVALDQDTLTRADYVRGRAEILAPAQRAKHPDAEEALPPLEFIDNLLRRKGFDWDELLRRAGLAPSTREAVAGLDPEAAVRLMASDLGGVPRGPRDLARWAKLRGVALQGGGEKRKHISAADVRKAIKAVQRERREAGEKPVPMAEDEQIAAAAALPPITDPSVPRARVVAPRWDRERLLDGMAEAVRRLNGHQLDQRSLKAEAKRAREAGDASIPSYSTVYNHLKDHDGESFADWIAEAERRAREAA